MCLLYHENGKCLKEKHNRNETKVMRRKKIPRTVWHKIESTGKRAKKRNARDGPDGDFPFRFFRLLSPARQPLPARRRIQSSAASRARQRPASITFVGENERDPTDMAQPVG